ncbi:MAG: 50S ribosomal protein L22 [Nanohaloarchaea archaeon SW_7_46_7]|nr:MAG: 50S ribosomal protein L22 [Nanohaloarchaea archaeon SW_7_46_7]
MRDSKIRRIFSKKYATEIGRFIDGDTVEKAKGKLEKVIREELPVPYTKFDSDVGHRSGAGDSGRFPVKAAEHILEVLEEAEANAEHEGLNPGALAVDNVITNQGQEFVTPGRFRGEKTKAAHVKIVVGEQ